MRKEIGWNFREVFLDGSVGEKALEIERMENCRACNQ
jgi:hypothetical protein